MMQAMKVDGMDDLDHGALVRHYEKLAHAAMEELLLETLRIFFAANRVLTPVPLRNCR